MVTRYSYNGHHATCDYHIMLHVTVTLCYMGDLHILFYYLTYPNIGSMQVKMRNKSYNEQVVTQFCVCVLWSRRLNFDHQVGRSGKTLLLLGNRLAAAGTDNGIQVFTASMLIVLWLISLTVALATGLARVYGPWC